MTSTIKCSKSGTHAALSDIRMPSVETHYAAQREISECPPVQSPRSQLPIPKRPISNVEAGERSPKLMRSDSLKDERFCLEGTSEESMSEQGRGIQNLTRQVFQKHFKQKHGNTMDAEDSVEIETRKMTGKTDLEGGLRLTPAKRNKRTESVIPIKSGGIVEDDSMSLSSSREYEVAIQPPALSVDQPSIKLLPGSEPDLPKDKRVPTKHGPKAPTNRTRALAIPTAKAMRNKIKMANPQPASTFNSPTKLPVSAKFTMGSIPTNTNHSPRRRSQRVASKGRPQTSVRSGNTSSVSKSAIAKEMSIRAVSKSRDIEVPVKFHEAKEKRKYVETYEASPSKRIKVTEVIVS